MYFSTALIIILTVSCILVYFLQKQHEEDDAEQNNSSRSSSLLDNRCRCFSLAEIKLATNDFDDAFVIGQGGFGKVYKGKIEFGEGIDVAIKRLNLDSSQGATEFRAEIEMLSKFRHSHIVSLLGYHEASDKTEMILVYEYMPNGSLEDHLHKIRINGSDSSQLTWVQRLQICIGAARGLEYLHSGTDVQSRVIHRDVKSSNILLAENLAAKICDFGLSRIGPANLVGTTNVYTDQIKGTFGYMDAEYFATHRLTRKSDVYAFGVILLEVLCGRPALDFTLDEQQQSLSVWAKQCIREGNIDRIIDPSLRGQTRTKFLKEFGRIAYECVLARSKDRPTMSKVVARLELVLGRTLQNGLTAHDQKHNGKSMFIDKAWWLFLIKPPKSRMNSPIEKLGQGIDNKKKGILSVEGGGQSGDVATTSRQVVLPTEQTKIPISKMYTSSVPQSATRNFRQDMVTGEGGFGKLFKGRLDSVTFGPRSRRVSDGLAVAIKRRSSEYSVWGPNEWQSFQLDTESGKKCYMMGARALSIAWQDEPDYWEWGHIPESRFAEVCKLRHVCWLSIHGKIAAMMLSQNSTYGVYLVFQTTKDSWGLDVPAKTRVRFHGKEMKTKKVYLQRPQHVGARDVCPRPRNDGWMEIKLGEFKCNVRDDGEVEMAFEEVKHLNWKNGLIVEGIELRPK